MKRFVAGVWIAVVVLVIVGCGGTASNSSDTSATISRADYVKQADAICGRTEKKQLKLLRIFATQKSTQKARVELVEHAGIPPLQEQAKKLSELPEPSEGAAEAKAYVVAFSDGVNKAEEDPGSLLEAPSPFGEAEALAAKFGFKVCSGP